MKGIYRTVGAGLMAATVAVGAATEGNAPGGLPLDLAVSFAPVACGTTLRFFSAEGPNQVMAVDDPAPQCSPVPLRPLSQPLCDGGIVWVLDTDGNLWSLGASFPTLSASGLGRPVGLIPAESAPVLLYPDHLQFLDGRTAAFPFQVRAGNGLKGGGFWVYGSRGAARLDPKGGVLWRWIPDGAEPGPASLSGRVLYSGDSKGGLVALRDSDGKLFFRFQGGGALLSPPIVEKGLVFFASSDHFIRAIKGKGGLLAWQRRTEGRPSFGPYRVRAGLLFAEASGSRLVLLSPEEGRVGWTWRVKDGAILAPPALLRDRAVVLVWTDSSHPVLHRVELPRSFPKEKIR